MAVYKSKNVLIDKETEGIIGLRSIVKMGLGFYINVPSEFMRKFNLKKGDKLVVIGKDSFLKYTPLDEAEKKK